MRTGSAARARARAGTARRCRRRTSEGGTTLTLQGCAAGSRQRLGGLLCRELSPLWWLWADTSFRLCVLPRAARRRAARAPASTPTRTPQAAAGAAEAPPSQQRAPTAPPRAQGQRRPPSGPRCTLRAGTTTTTRRRAAGASRLLLPLHVLWVPPGRPGAGSFPRRRRCRGASRERVSRFCIWWRGQCTELLTVGSLSLGLLRRRGAGRLWLTPATRTISSRPPRRLPRRRRCLQPAARRVLRRCRASRRWWCPLGLQG